MAQVEISTRPRLHKHQNVFKINKKNNENANKAMAEILEDKDFNLNMTSHLIYAAVKKCPCGLDVYRENINDEGRNCLLWQNNNR